MLYTANKYNFNKSTIQIHLKFIRTLSFHLYMTKINFEKNLRFETIKQHFDIYVCASSSSRSRVARHLSGVGWNSRLPPYAVTEKHRSSSNVHRLA